MSPRIFRGPPETANESRLPCRVTRGDFRPLFYLGHTPSPRRFEHLADLPGTDHHAGSHGPSRVNQGLRRKSRVAIGCYSEDTSALGASFQMSQFPHASRLRDVVRFQGRERRSRPLPASVGFSQFGIASLSTYRQALAGLSWLSSSPRAIYARRRASHGPVPLVTKSEAPHAGHG